MLTITLIRKPAEGKAVRGTMTIPFTQRPVNDKPEQDAVIATLENADFIIPAGTYPLERTWSPKFRKLLPIVQNVPDREGIRIHRGTIPEHSTGCILTDARGSACLDVLFNRLENYYDNEPIQLQILGQETL